MFKYLNSISPQLKYLNDNIRIHTTTIDNKPSSALNYLSDTKEVFTYLEMLVNSNNFTPNIIESNPIVSDMISLSSDQRVTHNRKLISDANSYSYNIN